MNSSNLIKEFIKRSCGHMANTDFDTLKKNILKDIDEASGNDINEIYSALSKAIAKFDRDSILKDFIDLFRSILKTKRQKCKLFINDIVDSSSKLTTNEKELLRLEFLDISNIHRTLLENIRSLLDAL
jgi:hypothetical protein